MNIKIREIEIYHPENLVDNAFYTEKFKTQGKDITRLLESFGKDKRYIANKEKENTLSLGYEASKKGSHSRCRLPILCL